MCAYMCILKCICICICICIYIHPYAWTCVDTCINCISIKWMHLYQKYLDFHRSSRSTFWCLQNRTTLQSNFIKQISEIHVKRHIQELIIVILLPYMHKIKMSKCQQTWKEPELYFFFPPQITDAFLAIKSN